MGEAIKKQRVVGDAPTVEVRAADGSVVRQATLRADVFAVTPNVPLMHQVVNAQLAAARAGTQSTKTRAEVSGGGAKPWRQKGTGRARQGSTRAPHFSGGGVALGPKPRSYRQATPKKMVQGALRSALSDRAQDGKVIVFDGAGFDTPKTKTAVTALKAWNVDGSLLIVLGDEDETTFLSFRNLTKVHVVHEQELNVFDVLRHDFIAFTEATAARVQTGSSQEVFEVTPTAETANASDDEQEGAN